jgi:cyclic pyranopterin phosphate synthase
MMHRRDTGDFQYTPGSGKGYQDGGTTQITRTMERLTSPLQGTSLVRMDNSRVLIEPLYDDVVLPARATAGSAGHDLRAYLRERRVSVRFIELMRTNDNVAYFERHHVRADAMERTLVESGWVRMMRAADAGPAIEYVHPDYAGRIGIIAPYSRDFCAGCNRLRVTARGDLRLCLFGDHGVPLRTLLQSDDDREALVDLIASQLRLKAAGHGLHAGDSGITPHLASIGG